jgi:hypothetical protein
LPEKIDPIKNEKLIQMRTEYTVEKLKYYVSGHYPSSHFHLKHKVSETGFCLSSGETAVWPN